LGAMGSFFAPKLEALLHDDFYLIAEGARKERLEKTGVQINGKVYRLPVKTPEEREEADLIIAATKGYSLDQAICDIRNHVGKETLILPVLNGVESEEKMIRAYGEEHVLHAFMRVSIVMKDGVTSYDPALGAVYFGERTNDPEALSERVLRVKDLFDRAGIRYRIGRDMVHDIWFKFACNVGENLTSALLGVPFGVYTWCEDADYIRIGAMREVQAVAARKGIILTDEEIEKQGATLRDIPPRNRPSTLQDLDAGKHTEIDMFAGTVVRLGEEYGIPTPICTLLLHGIKAREYLNDHRDTLLA
ncbi:MAG: 2-dehydropantoate 2-reductase, partial [Blautia sp.]|nr:2-dehydropantoate 2-reductase [Blautia sp.]